MDRAGPANSRRLKRDASHTTSASAILELTRAELNGICAGASQQATLVLARGSLAGTSPNRLARMVAETIAKVGKPVWQGLRFLRAELPPILATPPDVLSPRMVRVIRDLAEDRRRLDERIDHSNAL